MSRSDDVDQLGLWPLGETREVEEAPRSTGTEKKSPATTTSKPPRDTASRPVTCGYRPGTATLSGRDHALVVHR